MYNATKGIFQLIAFLVRTGEAFFIMNGLSHPEWAGDCGGRWRVLVYVCGKK